MYKQAERVAKHLARHGIDCEIKGSALSESCYVIIRTENRSYKLRGSNHVAKPTYEMMNGVADFEFGQHDMAQGDALDAVRFVLRSEGIEADATLKALATKEQAALDARLAERAANAAIMKSLNDEVAEFMSKLKIWAGERWAAAEAKATGKKRKEAKARLRKEYIRVHGLEAHYARITGGIDA